MGGTSLEHHTILATICGQIVTVRSHSGVIKRIYEQEMQSFKENSSIVIADLGKLESCDHVS